MIDGVGERPGGVPLFVEEVTRLLLERDVQGGVQAIPPTLQQSLAARLDRLGEAREVAQIGAVLGRDFSYRLLSDVATAAGFDELRLQAALDRLAEADLLFVEGAPPQANYRFKHALIQDAAYDSLLKSRRQALHRRAAEALRDAQRRARSDRPSFHRGRPRRSRRSNGGARRATRRSAARLSRRRSPISARRSRWRTRRARGRAGGGGRPSEPALTQLHVAYGNALMRREAWRVGNDGSVRESPRVGGGRKDAPERLAADYGLWAGSFMRGELSQCGRTQRPSSGTSRRGPIRPRPASLTAPPGSLLVRRRISRAREPSRTRAALF